MLTPEKGKQEEQVSGAEPDLVDILLSRLSGGPGNSELPGNGTGAVENRATTVPTSLTRATKRLVEVGTTPLRVPERWGTTFAKSMLQASRTFTKYLERKAQGEGGKWWHTGCSSSLGYQGGSRG